MSIGRWFAVALGLGPCLCPLAPSAAQVAPRAQTAAQTGADIVVQATADKPSAWHRAESAHVVVTSKGSETELRRVTTNLERLHALMSRLYRRPDTPDDTVKLQIVLVDSSNFFRAMGLKNLRSEEGPYAASFIGQRYYDPRADGELLAVARTDQVVDLDTAFAEDKDFQDSLDGGGGDGSLADMGHGGPAHPPIERPWEAVLYSAFAQHFALTYLPAAYPRWYLDGLGALFSTMKVRHDGTIDYARAPDGYRQVLRSYTDLNVGDVLTGRYLDTPAARTSWTPYHAWLMTHFFVFSKVSPERIGQFDRYMMAIRQGVPMAEAAKAFGDLNRLQREIRSYAEGRTTFARADPPRTLGGDVLVNALTRGSAAVLEARIELGTRLAGDAGPGRAAWLGQLHDMVARLPYNADAILLEAEAACGGEQYDMCCDAAARVLAKAPGNVRALSWKGVALAHLALAGPAADRAAGLAEARTLLQHANTLDPDASLPLIAYFRSFTDAGEKAPEAALRGMAQAIRAVPAAPAPRLWLAQELVRQDQAEVAHRLLSTVLYGGYDSPEKTAAQALLARGGDARPARR